MTSEPPLWPLAAVFVSLLMLLPSSAIGAFNPVPPGGANTSTSTQSAAGTCLDGVAPPIASSSLKIAVVEPVFTATPYSGHKPGSFYNFYLKYGDAAGNITTDLGWLSTPVSAGQGFQGGWGLGVHLYQFLTSAAAKSCGLLVGHNVSVVTDINVSEGALFSGGTARFGVVVIGFAEYVTQEEYTQLERFVASGGRLVIMGGDDLVVRVDYNPATGNETYVVGHGFAFNGVTAWRSQVRPFQANNTDWVASNYCCFHRFSYDGATLNQSNPIGSALQVYGSSAFGEYSSHEEAGLTNSSMTTLIGTFVDKNGTLVAAYAHRYGRGTVVCMCIFADDILFDSPSAQYFLVLAVSLGDLWSGTAAGVGSAYLTAVAATGVIALAVAAYAVRTRARRLRLASTAEDPAKAGSS